MKAEELRIGNIIKINDTETVVEGFSTWDNLIQSSDFAERDISEFEQIPLTEEWLLKFGAKWDSDYVALEVNKLTIRTHLPNMKPASIFAYFDGIRIKQLKYVHELQNLYFALTGQELTIK